MRDKKSQALELGFEMARFRLLDNFVETSKFDEFQKLFASYFLGKQYDCWSEIERNLTELVQRDSEGYLRKMRAFSRSVDVKYFLELHHENNCRVVWYFACNIFFSACFALLLEMHLLKM